MQIDAFIVLAACLAAAEIVLGGALVTRLVTRRARSARAPSEPGPDPAPNSAPGARQGVVASRLLVVTVASLPVLYVLLLRAVDATPGVMCVQGVLREESRGIGIGPYLPWILGAAVAARAAAVLAAGAARTLSRVDHRAHAGPLARRVGNWMGAAGLCAVVGAAATLLYVAAPRVAAPSAGGCCLAVVGTSDPLGIAAGTAATSVARSVWTAAFLLAGIAALAAATWVARAGAAARTSGAAALAVTSVAATVAGAAFFSAALAPARLGLPFHECAFCLLREAPELWAGVVLLAAGGAAAFWAVLAARAAAACGVREEAAPTTSGLLGFQRFAYAATLAMAVSARWWA